MRVLIKEKIIGGINEKMKEKIMVKSEVLINEEIKERIEVKSEGEEKNDTLMYHFG